MASPRRHNHHDRNHHHICLDEEMDSLTSYTKRVWGHALVTIQRPRKEPQEEPTPDAAHRRVGFEVCDRPILDPPRHGHDIKYQPDALDNFVEHLHGTGHRKQKACGWAKLMLSKCSYP